MLPMKWRRKSFCPMRPSGESHFSKRPCRKPPLLGGGADLSSRSAAISLRFSSSASNSCRSSAALWRGRSSLRPGRASSASSSACAFPGAAMYAASRSSASSDRSVSSVSLPPFVGSSWAFSSGRSISSSASSLEKLSRLRRAKMLSVSSDALFFLAIVRVSPWSSWWLVISSICGRRCIPRARPSRCR